MLRTVEYAETRGVRFLGPYVLWLFEKGVCRDGGISCSSPFILCIALRRSTVKGCNRGKQSKAKRQASWICWLLQGWPNGRKHNTIYS